MIYYRDEWVKGEIVIGSRKKPSYQCVVEWLSKSLFNLQETLVKSSFVACGIVRGQDFNLSQLNTKLRRCLFDKSYFEQEDKVWNEINAEQDS